MPEESPEERRARLTKAFKVFDKNGDGFISAGELKDLLTRTGAAASGITTDDTKKIIAKFDKNGDGKLSIKELVSAWSQIGSSNAKLSQAVKAKQSSGQG